MLTRDDVRWYPIREPNKFPRAVWVVTKGKDPIKVANISANAAPELWQRWQPVLIEWYRRKQTEKRINHDELTKVMK